MGGVASLVHVAQGMSLRACCSWSCRQPVPLAEAACSTMLCRAQAYWPSPSTPSLRGVVLPLQR